ncbi:MAG TPA: GGDEF domain-containing protein [Pilimelia sp.]|nr:GGDEF domain-containing protein [Pilimelia sp.]
MSPQQDPTRPRHPAGAAADDTTSGPAADDTASGGDADLVWEPPAPDATCDPLTRLAGPALFARRLAEALTPRGPGTAPPYVAVLAVDVDDFAAVNDALGRDAGDEALMGLSDRLLSCLRGSDLAARLGGDGFAILLPGTTAGEATLVAQRLLTAVAPPVLAGGRLLPLRVSVGVAGSAALGPAALVGAAEAALSRAKAGGKGRYAL